MPSEGTKGTNMKRVGVIGIPDKWSSEALAEAVSKHTGERHLFDFEKLKLDLQQGTVYHDDIDLGTFDALLIKKLGRVYSPDVLERVALLGYLEDKGVRIFSSPESILRAVDRLRCTIHLQQSEIPIPPTVITEDPAAAADAIREFGQAVLKPLYTSKARGMQILKADQDLEKELTAFREDGNQIIYIQKVMQRPDRDLGIVFLGGEYIGCYARVSDGGSWNTTTHSGGHYEAHTPSDALIELADRAQKPFGLDFTCVDVMETPEGPMVLEVSAFGGFRGLWETSDLDAARRYAEYAIKEISEQ